MAGETFAFTEKLEVPRGIAAQAAVEMGCNVADGVNKRTTILIVGDQDLRRTKHRKAEDMIGAGAYIRIVEENSFMLMVSPAVNQNATA